jgi:xylose isomerase
VARGRGDPGIDQGGCGVGSNAPGIGGYSAAQRDALLGASFDRAAIAKRGLAYERLDQLTVEVLLGAR